MLTNQCGGAKVVGSPNIDALNIWGSWRVKDS
jgi:hypothetical protein